MAVALVKSNGAATVESRFHAVLSTTHVTTRVFAAIGVALTILTVLTISAGVYFVAVRTGGDIYHRIPDVERKAPADAEADRIAAQKAEADRIAAQKAAEKAEAERTAAADAEKAQADRTATIESNPQPSLDACELENQKVVAIDLAAVDAGRQLQKLQGEFVCPTSQTAAKEAAKTFSERTRSAQSELARIGCYDGPVNGELDVRTRDSMTRYLVAKHAAIVEPRLTDVFLSELKRRGPGLCSIARLPDKEEQLKVAPRPMPEIKHARPPVEPSTHHPRPRAQPVEPTLKWRHPSRPMDVEPQRRERPSEPSYKAEHHTRPTQPAPPAPSPHGPTNPCQGGCAY